MNGHPLSYAIIDIDHFKRVNDKYGHQVGDWVIKSLARLLKFRMRKSGMIGRIGGEEFGIILPGVSAQDASRLIDRVRAEFGRLVHKSGPSQFGVTFSCGIADIANFQSPVDVSTGADSELYAVKEHGRDQVKMAS